MLSLRITGNSHVGALKHGAEITPIPEDIDLRISGIIFGQDQRQPFHEIRGGKIYFATRRKRQERFSEVMGKDHIDPKDGHIWGICMQPHSEYVYTGKTLKLSDDAEHALAFMTDLRWRVRSFAILTPGVRRDNRAIGDLGEASRIDTEMREYARSRLEALGIDVINELPEGHEGGFLKPEYYRADGLVSDHANAAYGAKMMERVLDFVKERYG